MVIILTKEQNQSSWESAGLTTYLSKNTGTYN